jgi:hypothetical protein
MSSNIILNLNENNINIESNINSLSLEQLLDTQDILNILSNYKNNSSYYH